MIAYTDFDTFEMSSSEKIEEFYSFVLRVMPVSFCFVGKEESFWEECECLYFDLLFFLLYCL